MDDVETDEKRNTQPRFRDCGALQPVHVARSDHIEQVADRAGPDGVDRILDAQRPRHGIPAGAHGELAELFGQRHGADQRVDAAHVVRIPVRATT